MDLDVNISRSHDSKPWFSMQFDLLRFNLNLRCCWIYTCKYLSQLSDDFYVKPSDNTFVRQEQTLRIFEIRFLPLFDNYKSIENFQKFTVVLFKSQNPRNNDKSAIFGKQREEIHIHQISVVNVSKFFFLYIQLFVYYSSIIYYTIPSIRFLFYPFGSSFFKAEWSLAIQGALCPIE